jgi:hypothetical protein
MISGVSPGCFGVVHRLSVHPVKNSENMGITDQLQSATDRDVQQSGSFDLRSRFMSILRQ